MTGLGPIGKIALRYNKLEHILKDGKAHTVRSLFNIQSLQEEFVAENAIDNALRRLAKQGKVFKTPYKDNQYPNIRFAYEWKNKDEHKPSIELNVDETGIRLVAPETTFKTVVIINEDSIFVELERFKVTINLK